MTLKKLAIIILVVLASILSVIMFLHIDNKSDIETITICGGCQGRYEDLSVGFQLTDGVYTLKSGEQVEGRMAKLWFSVRDKSEENKVVTMRLGENITLDKYIVTVDYIYGGRGSVDLTIKEIPQQTKTLWIILGLIVFGAVGGAYYFLKIRKSVKKRKIKTKH